MRVRVDIVEGRAAPRRIVLEASSVAEARLRAARMGHAVLSCRAVGADIGAMFTRASGRSGSDDVVVFVEQLRDLLAAGLSVIEALEALQRGARGDFARVIRQLETELKTGRMLSAALAQEPRFPPLLVALVHSAEQTSDLQQTLSRFLEHQARVAELRHRLVSAMVYPVLLTGVGALVLTFLMFYVMPRFARVFEGMTGDLPWSAQAMLSWSRLLGEHSTLVSMAFAALVGAMVLMLSSRGFRAMAFRSVLAWTPLRERMNTYFLVRWYRVTGMLVTGGIPLAEALHLSTTLLPPALREAGSQVERHVRDGLAPSAAHARAGMATPVAEQLLLAGERTGDLGPVLIRIAQFHESEIGRTMERAMRAVEPVVMVLIGLGVGIIVVLMYLPIFELASAVQ